MPNVNWSTVEESAGGTFRMPEPGGYICVITGVKSVPEKQYVGIMWDIAEGEFKGCYESSQYPPMDIMSYKPNALPMTKHKLHVLADDNAGFRSSAAFNSDNWDAFVGKRFGAVLRKRIYTKKNGQSGEAIEIGAWKRCDEIRSGQWKPMAPRDQTTGGNGGTAPIPTPAQAPTYDAAKADVYDEDIPF